MFVLQLLIADLVFSSSLLEGMPSFPMFDDDENSLPVSGNDTFNLPNLNKHRRYQCHSCEQPCSEETICNNAYQVLFLYISCERSIYSFLNIVIVLEISCSRFFRAWICFQGLHYKCWASCTLLQYIIFWWKWRISTRKQLLCNRMLWRRFL